MTSLPPAIISILLPFSSIFLRPKVWSKALLLVVGAILCRGGRTVCTVLRVLGMKGEERFDKYHRVLSRDTCHLLKGAKILLEMLVDDGDEPIVIAIDEHIERRNGQKIRAKGCYRDAVRSSKSYVVKCFGLKWITVMVIKKFSWAKRAFALPFLTVLASSKKADEKVGKTHKTPIHWAIQVLMLVRRWFPKRKIILVGDGGFANIVLAWVCLKHQVSLVTRLRLDARLYTFPEPQLGPGRPAKKGRRLLPPRAMYLQKGLKWIGVQVQWYGGIKTVEYLTITCLWHVVGYEPVPLRLLLLRDPDGKYESVPLMSTDVQLSPQALIEAFVSRWNQEVTHREARDYLGVETQRQWSDRAIARSTPVLFGLYSLVLLMANGLNKLRPLQPERTAWYCKETVTFSDALKEVRRHLWVSRYLESSEGKSQPYEIPSEDVLHSLIDQLSRAA